MNMSDRARRGLIQRQGTSVIGEVNNIGSVVDGGVLVVGDIGDLQIKIAGLIPAFGTEMSALGKAVVDVWHIVLLLFIHGAPSSSAAARRRSSSIVMCSGGRQCASMRALSSALLTPARARATNSFASVSVLKYVAVAMVLSI